MFRCQIICENNQRADSLGRKDRIPSRYRKTRWLDGRSVCEDGDRCSLHSKPRYASWREQCHARAVAHQNGQLGLGPHLSHIWPKCPATSRTCRPEVHGSIARLRIPSPSSCPLPSTPHNRFRNLEYLLLPPRSALAAASSPSRRRLLHNHHALLLQSTCPAFWVGHRSHASAPSIFRASPFGRWVITLLSGCRLSWPPPCCPDEPTPFMVSHEPALRPLSPTFGSSRIASSAYQNGPLRARIPWSRVNQEPSTTAYPFKVWE